MTAQSYLERCPQPTIGPSPLTTPYPTAEALKLGREALEEGADTVERIALMLGVQSTPEAAPHAPRLEPQTGWALYYFAVCVALAAEETQKNARTIIDAVTDLATFQADCASWNEGGGRDGR
jgi:hypothetical protein